ncbi:hypothetical protein Nepgr_003142 [Nepenthes gracilis]|uniref:Uncharacterized protein n=1 Tax=Nepenthes gracilis TaxID=150966 RepID=A0AAD3XD07_NEPGR|nr:hypothetical protein Nepgr_003142 [Nepenthes gracilis]
MGTASFRCSGGLDLDLNRVDEVPEVGQPPLLRTKYLASTKRNFDLNNGPAVDEAIAEPSSYNQQHRANFPVQPPTRIDNIEIGNLSSWYPPWSTYSAVPISSLLSDRGEQPFPFVGTSGSAHRILGGAAGSTPLNLDPCRGTVLSSAAVPFPSTPYQYPIFPFGTSFPVPSSSFSSASSAYVDMSSGGRLCVPAVPSQLLGTATAVSSQYPRPYVVSLPDISGNIGVDGSNKFRKQSLDLNAGPGVHDVERRAEAAPIMSRRVPEEGARRRVGCRPTQLQTSLVAMKMRSTAYAAAVGTIESICCVSISETSAMAVACLFSSCRGPADWFPSVWC